MAQQPEAPRRWPVAWQAALGRVSAATPLLIMGREQQKADEMLDSLASEFGSRLTKLGRLGEPAALMAALAGALGGSPWPQLPAPVVRMERGKLR